MNFNKIDLNAPHATQEKYELDYIKIMFNSNWKIHLKNNIKEFEDELLAYLKTEKIAVLNSSTSAAHMALKACGVKEGDIVICQDLISNASANPILYEKAIPVLVDSDFETWNTSPIALRKALTKYPNSKAVIVANILGLSANYDEIVKICDEFNVPLIEDASESFGTVYNGQKSGTFGKYGIFSFDKEQIVTTLAGGAVSCNDKSIAEEKIARVKFLSTLNRDSVSDYDYNEMAYDYSMTNVAAGFGRGQIKKVHIRIPQKRTILNYYKLKFINIKEISFFPIDLNGKSNCTLSTILVKDFKTPSDIIKVFADCNIEARRLNKPIHLQKIFKAYDYIDNNNVSTYLYEHAVCLPSSTKMKFTDIERLCDIIVDMFRIVNPIKETKMPVKEK